MGVLSKTPQLDNWVDRLPAGVKAAWHRSIIYRCAVHLHRERGMTVGNAIASAINWCRSTLATGDIKNWPGPQQVNPKSLAEMASALALWETMKGYARSDNAGGKRGRRG